MSRGTSHAESGSESTLSWLEMPFFDTRWGMAMQRDPRENRRSSNLNRRFVHALGSVQARPPRPQELDGKPFSVYCKPPLPVRLRVYLYEATTNAAERQEGAYRCQLTGLSAQHGERLYFDRTGGQMPVLAGYVAEWDLFILWDAELIDLAGFTFSRNVQVGGDTVMEALTRPFATAERKLRPSGRSGVTETVVVVRAANLCVGLQQRCSLSRAALLEL